MRTALAAVALLAVAGCGGSSDAPAAAEAPPATSSATAPSPSPVLSQKEQAAAYLRITAPANATIAVFQKQMEGDPTQAETAAAAEPVAAAYERVNQELARVGFTEPAATDVRTLIAADARLIGDLRAVGSQSAFSVDAFLTMVSQDIAAAGAAVDRVRADLGLPPRK